MHKTATSFTHRKVILFMQCDPCRQNIPKVINWYKLYHFLATPPHYTELTSSSWYRMVADWWLDGGWMVAEGCCSILKQHLLHTRNWMVHLHLHVTVYWCCWLSRMGSILMWQMNTSLLVIRTSKNENSMKRTFCYHSSSQHLGTPLGTKSSLPLWQSGCCGYLDSRDHQVSR